MAILSMVNAIAMMGSFGSMELADLVEPIKVLMVFLASATLASLLTPAENVSNPTSSPPATKTKDTTPPSRHVSALQVLNTSEENV